MSKKHAAYLRGLVDGKKDSFQFLEDIERSLYAIQLTMETSDVSEEYIIEKLNVIRRAISEYQDGVNGPKTEIPEWMKVSSQGKRVRTIMDLQEDDNMFTNAFESMEIDKEDIEFLLDQDI